VFHVQVRISGFPARTASFRTRAAAKKWATTVEAEMIEGRHFRSVEARRRNLGDAIDRYLRDELPKKADQTPKGQLLWWKDEIGHVKLGEITPALLAECRDKLLTETYQRAKPGSKNSGLKAGEKARRFKRKPATVNRYLANLSSVFTIARREWHWIGYNPVGDVSRFGEDDRVRWLSDDERRALLRETAKDPTLHVFVLIALSTACRAGEILKLKWDDVDLKAGRLLFRKTKNREARNAWLHGEVLKRLEEHGKVRDLGGKVFVNPGGTRRARGQGVYDYAEPFDAAVAAAGIKNFHFHDLRHTAATYLAQQGATEQQLRAIGGWKSSVVRRYVHLAAHDAKAALVRLADKIDGKPGDSQ
jgi:integrase